MAPVAGYIAQVTLQYQSGLPRDVTENVFHFVDFSSDTASVAAAQQIAQRLADFYSAPVGGNCVDSFFSPLMLPLAKVKVYDFGAAHPRPILYQDSWTMGLQNASLGALPPEVALCISAYGTVNVKRERGRQYIGPFALNAITTGPDGYSEPSPNLITALVAAGKRLSQNTGDVAQGSTTLLPGTPATGPAKALWAVLSMIGTGTKAAPAPNFTLINSGWVDNEWDGQRRRRVASTARSTWAPS